MPSLQSLKSRIKSVKSTQKITKAMKMVAASKLKRARIKADNAKEYADQMTSLVQNVSNQINGNNDSDNLKLLTGTGSQEIILLIVFTSNRGLCGAFNQNVLKLVRKHIHDLENDNKIVKLIIIGKKGSDILKRVYASKIIAYYNEIGLKGIKFDEANQIAEDVLIKFEKNEFDSCNLIYSKFKSVIAQIPMSQQIIPLAKDDSDSNTVYEYEPSEEDVIQELLPKNIAVQIFRALLESSASEQGARMTAMENATRNSTEMIKKLNLLYNRTRQAYITKELIEIISGAEAI